MKTWLGMIALGVVALGATPTSAQTDGGFEIGAEVFDYGYRERFEGDTVVFDDGAFGAGRLDYVETVGGGTFLRSRLHAAFGSVDYRSGDDERLENVSQDIVQLELQVGHDIAIGRGATLTPFVGLGGRLLTDKSGGEETQGGLLGYDRELSYSYVPAGAALSFAVGRGNRIILSGQYNWLVGGDVRSELSQVDPELPDVELDLDEGRGLEASAALRLGFGRRALGVGPFVRHWSLAQSKSFTVANPEDPAEQIEFSEPRNRTTEFGLRIALAF